MLKQGIAEKDITVYQDKEGKGCLDSCMQSFSNVPTTGGTWHLQDDIVLSSDFKRLTEKYDYGIACGICTQYDDDNVAGQADQTNIEGMWYSFPCIRIPNKIARKFVEWFYQKETQETYKEWIARKKYDDSLFKEYLETQRPNISIHNMHPNIVNHIDYLLGGSIVNKQRDKNINTMAKYWTDEKTLQDIEKELAHGNGV